MDVRLETGSCRPLGWSCRRRLSHSNGATTLQDLSRFKASVVRIYAHSRHAIFISGCWDHAQREIFKIYFTDLPFYSLNVLPVPTPTVSRRHSLEKMEEIRPDDTQNFHSVSKHDLILKHTYSKWA